MSQTECPLCGHTNSHLACEYSCEECLSNRPSPPAEPKCETFPICTTEPCVCIDESELRPPTTEPAESEGKEIDRWAVGQALNDLHFQKDSVRKCAAVNDLLERAEREQFRRTNRTEPPTAPPAEEHFVDANKKLEDAKALLPCPFCGAEGRIEKFDEMGENPDPDYRVDCSSCPVATYMQSTEEAAIKVWNTRDSKQIERQTPAIIERFKRESGFDAIKFNGDCAEQLLREQGIYVADDGEVVNTQVETLVKALEKIGQCGAGHVCCNVNFHIAQNAIQTVKARRSGGEGKCLK